MKVKDLIEYLTEVTEDRSDGAEWPICVAFRWNGQTVVSDIVSVNINGKSIQLNEEDFVRHKPTTMLCDMGDDVGVIE